MKKLFTLLVIAAVTVFSVTAQVREDFEAQTEDDDIAIDGWINYAEAGTRLWYADNYNNMFAKLSAYKSDDDSNVAWLITPAVNLDEFPNDSIKFEIAYGYYTHDALKVMYSLDFNGKESGIASATWVDVTDQFSYPEKKESGYTDFLPTSTSIDHLTGNIHVAFVYSGNASNSETSTIELDNIIVGNPKPQSKIVAFSVAQQLLDSEIDADNATVELTVYPGTDVTGLAPAMELSEGASVSPAIGSAQDFTNPVKYTVTSSDGESVTEWTVTVNILSDVPVSIYDLQYVEDATANDASAYEGKPVLTTGVVTYGSGSGNAYVQSAKGEWNGVMVYVSTSVDNISLTKGDSVLMYGTIKEYYNLTEFIPDSVYTISDRKSVDAVTVTAPLTESLEGVLVKMENLTVKANGEESYYGITAANDTVLIENDLFSGLSLTEGSSYNLTGIVSFSYSEYRLYPRSAGDVEGGSNSADAFAANKLSVYPNPANNVLYIKGTEAENVQIYNVMGKAVKTLNVKDNSIDVTSLERGVYMLSVDSKVVRFVKQ